MLIFVYIFLQMPRPKKAGGPMSAAERAQRSRDKKREKDEAVFMQKEREERAKK